MAPPVRQRLTPRPAALASALMALASASLVAWAASATDFAAAHTVKVVVIDPGHGGAEEGATSADGLREKDLTLDLARRLAALLRVEGFEVVLTRDADVDLSLDDRAAVANQRHADVFISLHVNASRSAAARGAETYVLSTEATDDAARATAALENDAAGVGQEVAGDETLPLILWDLAQVEYLRESSRLADAIQTQLNEALGLKDRGVRQAPFRVLVGATCPAVLVELGFLSHADEGKLLSSPDHRRRLADALAAAIRQFRADAQAGK